MGLLRFGGTNATPWRALIGGALGVMLIVAGSVAPAVAGDDDDEDDTFDTRFMKGIMSGLGLSNTPPVGIDYHERSPLVVPPTRDLPPPQSDAAVSNNPAWPKDQDIARRKTKKKVHQAIPSERENMRQLTPQELNRTSGATAGRTVTDATGTTQSHVREQQMSPSQLGFNGFGWSMFGRGEENIQFTGEPPRTSLTEPPTGLRTPSAKYSYGTKGKLEADRSIRDKQEVGPDR